MLLVKASVGTTDSSLRSSIPFQPSLLHCRLSPRSLLLRLLLLRPTNARTTISTIRTTTITIALPSSEWSPPPAPRQLLLPVCKGVQGNRRYCCGYHHCRRCRVIIISRYPMNITAVVSVCVMMMIIISITISDNGSSMDSIGQSANAAVVVVVIVVVVATVVVVVGGVNQRSGQATKRQRRCCNRSRRILCVSLCVCLASFVAIAASTNRSSNG